MLNMECFAIFIGVSLHIDRAAWEMLKGAAQSSSGPNTPSLAGR